MINEEYFKEFPTLNTERLLLRKFRLSDAADILKIRSDQEIMRFMDSRGHAGIKDSEDFISENLKTYQKKNGIFWAIIKKSTGELIGDFSFWDIDKKNWRAQIGYTLKPEFWGNGFMKEAMIAIFRFGFDQLNLHSLEANINPENKNSRNILIRMGFVKEAYFRENYYYDGKFLDSEIYCLLQKDFIQKFG